MIAVFDSVSYAEMNGWVWAVFIGLLFTSLLWITGRRPVAVAFLILLVVVGVATPDQAPEYLIDTEVQP